jgi:hypothetical protein
MSTILNNAILLSLAVYFIKATTWSGMIWEKPNKWLQAKLPEKIYKPFIGCPVCMTPWWGLLIYYILHFTHVSGFGDIRAQVLILTLFVAAGISTIILMLNKVYDATIKEDKLLAKEMEEENII